MAFCPMKHCLAALLVLLLVCCGSTSAAATDAQVQATYNFLTKIASGIPTLAAKWTGSSYTGWEDITVDSTTGHVAVDLSNQGLSGWLPNDTATEDGILVTNLDLSDNPDITALFDESWANLKELKYLDLSSTNVYGTIPDAWNGMTSLISVRLYNLAACGGLPNWGSDMTALTTVDLSSASLAGSLAASWASIPNLATVDISGNSFCGCVPTAWTSNSVLSAATSGMAAADPDTCDSDNACTADGAICYRPIYSTSSTSTTSSTADPNKIEPTSNSDSAIFSRAVVASGVMLLVAITLLG